MADPAENLPPEIAGEISMYQLGPRAPANAES